MKSAAKVRKGEVKSEEKQEKREDGSSGESAEIKRLRRALEEKRLEAEMSARMIELAEADFGICIRKKRDTK